MKTISRRSFLKFLALLGFSLEFPQVLVHAKSKEPVGLIKSPSRIEGLTKGFGLVKLPDVVDKRVLIKPNFNTADPAPGSTHLDTLKTLIEELWKQGAKEVIIGERSARNTQLVMEQKGILALAKELDVKVIDFSSLTEEETVHIDPPGSRWPKGFHVPRILQEVDHIICAGCLKTHQYGGIYTMALKLAVGLIPANLSSGIMRTMHNSPFMRHMIAEINLAYSPSYYIIDGVDAFVKGGPATGTRVNSQVTLVARDPIAIDAVGLAILKQLGTTRNIENNPIFAQDQIVRAAELGLGISGPEQIELLTSDQSSKEYAAIIEEILSSEA